jgi:tetratricopeptide (TPR) repeat protein
MALAAILESAAHPPFDIRVELPVNIDGGLRVLTAEAGDTVETAVERFGFGLSPGDQQVLGQQLLLAWERATHARTSQQQQAERPQQQHAQGVTAGGAGMTDGGTGQSQLTTNEQKHLQHLELGNAQFAEGTEGASARALAEYDKALAYLPANKDTLYNRAVALQNMGSISEAVRAYSAVLDMDPRYADAQYHFGYCLLKQGEYAPARVALGQALALRPAHAGTLCNLGFVIERLLEAQAAAPDTAEAAEAALVTSALEVGATGRVGRPGSERSESLSEGTPGEAGGGRGWLAVTAEAVEQAYRRALAAEPAHLHALLSLADWLGRPCTKPANKPKAQDTSAQRPATRAQCRARLQETLALQERALAAAPAWAPALVARSTHLTILEGLSGRPGEPPADTRLADRALELAALHSPVGRSRAEAYFNLGTRLSQRAPPAGAEAAYRTALDADPAHVPTLVNLGLLLFVGSQIAAARAVLQQALEAEPGHPLALANLARVEVL